MEQKPVHRSIEGGGLLQIWLGEGLGFKVTQNRTAFSPSSQVAFSLLPFSLGHTPHASVQTHLLELPPPHRTPTPALGMRGILAMCRTLSAGGKEAK